VEVPTIMRALDPEVGDAVWVRVPAETGHPIRPKPATQSGRNRPPVPVDSGHPGRMRSGS